jgi:FkbM family methyltransferase
MLRSVAKNVNKILKIFGIQINRAHGTKARTDNRLSDVMIAGYRLRINNLNPLKTYYDSHPNYNSELKRVAKAIQKKYPQSGVIDIGANVGDTLVIIMSEVKTEFICIEGDRGVFDILKENSAQFKNVKVINQYLGEFEEEFEAEIEKKGWNSTIKKSDANSQEKVVVNIKTLDNLLAGEENINNFKLFKVDTEGYDVKIIRGAQSYLKSAKPVICMEYNRHNMTAIGEDGLSTLFLLEAMGYNKILIYESEGRLILSTSLREKDLIEDLHEYIDGLKSTIYYFDFCIFHECDNDLAVDFINSEKVLRRGNG